MVLEGGDVVKKWVSGMFGDKNGESIENAVNRRTALHDEQ